MAGTNLGRDRGVADRQILDCGAADGIRQLVRQTSAADQSRATNADVEIAEDAPEVQRPRPGLQLVELVGGVAAADQGADRGADNDVGLDPMLEQGVDHADMGEAARRPAAKNKTDLRPADRPRKRLGSNVGNCHQVLDSARYDRCRGQS